MPVEVAEVLQITKAPVCPNWEKCPLTDFAEAIHQRPISLNPVTHRYSSEGIEVTEQSILIQHNGINETVRGVIGICRNRPTSSTAACGKAVACYMRVEASPK